MQTYQTSRRELVKNCLAGTAALSFAPILHGKNSDATSSNQSSRAVSRAMPLNDDWLFSSEPDPSALEPEFDDRAFSRITLPHCVAPLSWQNWNPRSWETPRAASLLNYDMATSVVLSKNRTMRKRILESDAAQRRSESEQGWLDLDEIARVEVTSEDASFPIESALSPNAGCGWRASQKGEQEIRIIFDKPMSLHRIQLRFDETELERTHEFAVRWISAAGGPPQEIVRQQWNFSPAGSTTEVEDYTIELSAVSVLELAIKPDLARREAVASLTAWRLG
jgi:hypothetical protein